MTQVLVIDNYDSFTYNLVELLRQIGLHDIVVARNDRIEVDQACKHSHILLSPGPGIPSEAGIMPQLIVKAAPTASILGVCLGHQAIAEAFGGSLQNLGVPVHGKATPVTLAGTNHRIFDSLPTSFSVGRYHSWVVEPRNFPEDLEISAADSTGNIMALRHRQFDVHGVQFHPESVLTEHGAQIVKNWLRLV